jgi:DNA-binding winged helix-turn-helix (wHTH) protein
MSVRLKATFATAVKTGDRHMRDPNQVVPAGNGNQPATATQRHHLNFGCFALDLDGRILIDPSGRDVELRRREFDLLLTLARSPGRVMSRETLLDAIAGREAEAFDRTIDVYVGRLRRKIEADPKQPRLIVTVPGVGYRLAAKPRPANRQPDAEQRSDGAATHAGAGILAAINKANAGCDAQAASALYAENAIMTFSDGLLSGRAAIEEAYEETYERFTQHPSTLEHVVAIGSDMMLRAGTWSRTYQGPTSLVHQWGSWTTTDMLRGSTWQIRTETMEHSGSSVVAKPR